MNDSSTLAALRYVGVRPAWVPAKEYRGDRPNLDWPRFLRRIEECGWLHLFWEDGVCFFRPTPRVRTVLPKAWEKARSCRCLDGEYCRKCHTTKPGCPCVECSKGKYAGGAR